MALPDEPGWALFVDLDGTLCDYDDDPSRVMLDATQRNVLHALSLRLEGALCVISGRSDVDLARAIGDASLRRCAEHGRDPHDARAPGCDEELTRAEATMTALAAGFEGEGVWVERKPASCALHYRRAPALADRLTHAMRAAAGPLPLLRLLEGRCVLEMLPRRDNKGAALRRLMRTAPFAGRIPVALGDDVTDEDAFVAATALGGFGVGVGPRTSVAARYHLADAAACNAWLQRLANSTQPEESLDV